MPQLTPIRGFINTPVIRIICITSTILAVLISVFQIKYLFTLSIDPFILEYKQYWRIATYQVSVINESDYLLSIILWFHFKSLERFYGSREFLSLIVVLSVYNGIITFLIMTLGQLLINVIQYSITIAFNTVGFKYSATVLNSVIPGPIGIISSLYVCYGTYIPVCYHFKLILSDAKTVGETNPDSSKQLLLTDHFQIHILYTLLLINNGFKSLIPGLIGLFVGKLNTNDLLPGSKSWLIPTPMFRLFTRPIKTFNNVTNSITRRITGYNDVDVEVDEHEPEQQEEREDISEERNDEREIRAETPVRPLASQFLDTFRTD